MARSAHPRWRAALVIGVLMAGTYACGRGATVLETTPRQSIGDGTVTGIVTGPDGKSPLVDGPVEAINVANSSRVSARTNPAGGYTLKLPPGKYTIAPQLFPGETLAKQPPPMDIEVGEIETSVDFSVNGAARSRG